MAGNIDLPKKIVIDASAALAFLFPDERNKKIDFLFQSFIEGKVEILVPEIFYFEVFNGVKSAILRKRVDKKIAKKLLVNFLKFQIKKQEVDYLQTFDLALRKNISFYDASYLALSKANKIPFMTLDKRLL